MLTRMVIAAAEAENGFILPHKIEEVFWGSFAFVIVVGLIVWKGGPAIKTMWNDRIDRIRTELETAETARTSAEAKLTQVEASIADAENERARILAEATETAQSVRTQLVERASTDAADVRARGGADIESSKAQASSDLQSEIGVLALGAAEAVVANTLDDATRTDLIDGYITRVGAQS